jgi:Fe2+ transport system protein FeoA
VDRALRDVAERRLRRVVYFPFGFLADNAETLLEGRQALREEPGLEPLHLPCLNTDPGLLKALAAQIVAALPAVAEPARARGGDVPRRLDQLEPGERTIILRLEGDSGQERRLMELGLVPGTAIEMVRRAPFGDPVEFRVREVSLSLRRCETRRIHVAAP